MIHSNHETTKIDTALICVAGEGKRIASMTGDCPKTLIPVGEKSMLEHILDNFSACGVHHVVLLVGYKADILKEKIGKKYKKCNINYVYNEDYSTTDNLYSMWLAREYVTDGMIFLNGDILFNKKILEELLHSSFSDAIVVDQNIKNKQKNLVVVRTTADGAIDKIAHKDDMEKDYFGAAFGIYKLSQSSSEKYFENAKDFFKDGPRKGGFFFPLQKMVKTIPIYPVSTKGYPWASVNTLDEYNFAVESIDDITSDSL